MDAPVHLRRQAVLYSASMALTALHFPGPTLFALSIPSSVFAFFVPGTRLRLCISNLLFVLFLVFPETYFVCYGFTVASTHISISSLCLDSFQHDSLQIGLVMESMGLLLSLCMPVSRALSLCLAMLQFANIYFLDSPPIESIDYGRAYEKMASLLDGTSFTVRAREYRGIVGAGRRRLLDARPDFLTPLFMGRLSLVSKAAVCCSSLVLCRKSIWLCFIAYLLLLFEFEWCCVVLSFLCSFVPGHPTYRLASAQVLYLMARS